MAAVEAHLTRLAAFPLLAPAYFRTVRRQVMLGFPYGIFYEPHPTRIIVVAILDLRQDRNAFGTGSSSCPARAWPAARVPSVNA